MKLPCRKTPFFLVFVLQLVTCSLWGQVLQKKTLTINDYSKWGDLDPEKISPNGQWVSYSLYYQNGLDTLFVKNIKSLKTFPLPLGNRGSFITPDWFTYKTAKGLHLMNLKTEEQKIITGVLKDLYSAPTKQLLILVREKEKENTLLIQTADGVIKQRIEGVTEFVMDPAKLMVLYTVKIGNQYSINLLELSKKKQKTVLYSDYDSFSNLVWHKSGKALVFTQKSAGNPHRNTMFFYNLSSKKLYYSKAETQQKFLGDSLSIPIASYKLQISGDMHRIFFGLEKRRKLNDSIKNSNVQIWDGNAKWIYPTEEKQKNFKGNYLGLWFPEQDQYRLVSNDTLPQPMLTGDQKYAIVSNTKQYEPQYLREGPRDFYLLDLYTGKKELLLKKHPDYFLFTIPSPTGKYIAYFKQKNWWIYDIAKKTHTNITKNIGHPFFHNKSEQPGDDESYQNLGFTLGDKEILLCDAYDIWAITPDGTFSKRLTHGREIQTQFKLAGYSRIILGKLNYDGWILDPVDLDKGLLLEATDKNGGTGYYNWSIKSNDKLVFSNDTGLSQMIYNASTNTFMYLEQNYDLSPRLMAKTPVKKIPQIIVQSNPHQQQFYWGKSELIHYKNTKGIFLKGILYYPANYDSKKKYPMIVQVYQKFSHRLHNYINPSEFDGEGFNISTYTTQGYFVLLPDITYEIGNPGLSAVDCIVAATNEVIMQELVQRDKIGLIGHSFGAYESSFAITQTNLFAAAVAGAGITDLTSHYLSIGLFGKPLMWLFESHQFRMTKSLFEDREGYRRNSPIEHAENIKTPLLIWTGNEDDNVNWNQSREFYLALRRLGKPHMMLVYPKEGHEIENNQNQQDLSTRIHQWFDYYLKNAPAETWIKKGIQ
ncbi:prolyl oligopeptidase family serine peptidase [Flavobacterium tructae]|uniref:S9 family peptidase n=1 Tax=Flavobacterium tructae TaxID=1114873 RepID=UPI0035A8A633